jgi:hypothetical protein
MQSLLPLQSMVLETGTFDPHVLKNPTVLENTWLYQHGVNYGYANTKASVLTRDGYLCQQCKGKSKDQRLEVHHIVFCSEQGSDEETNLLTLCKACHESLHAGTITLKQTGKRKGPLLHATQMNSICRQLLKRVQAEETWGFVTKEHRQVWSLPKEHIFDAAVIATRGQKRVSILWDVVGEFAFLVWTHRHLGPEGCLFLRSLPKIDELKLSFLELVRERMTLNQGWQESM